MGKASKNMPHPTFRQDSHPKTGDSRPDWAPSIQSLLLHDPHVLLPGHHAEIQNVQAP